MKTLSLKPCMDDDGHCRHCSIPLFVGPEGIILSGDEYEDIVHAEMGDGTTNGCSKCGALVLKKAAATA